MTTFPEPPDGSMVVLIDRLGERALIWRDDAESAGWGGMPDEHWFDDGRSDPMGWAEHTRHAARIHAVSAEPVAGGAA